MASCILLIILAGFSAAFWGLESLEAVLPSDGPISPSQSCGAAQLAAGGALLLVTLATFVLTSLLLVTHARALGANNAAGGFYAATVGRLAAATLAGVLAALVAGAVLRVVVGRATNN